MQTIYQNSELDVTYFIYKKILTVSARDLLLVTRKYSLLGGACCTINRSFEHPTFPERQDRVRAYLALGGFFVRPLKGDNEGLTAEVTCLSKVNPKGYLPIAMMKNLSARELSKRARLIDRAMRLRFVEGS